MRHEGNSSLSHEEVQAIVDLVGELLGDSRTWTDADRKEAPLRPPTMS